MQFSSLILVLFSPVSYGFVLPSASFRRFSSDNLHSARRRGLFMVEESDEQKTYWDLKREQVENADAAKSEGSALSNVGEPRNVTPVVASIAVVAVAAIVNLALGRAALEQREQVVNEQGEKKHIKEQEKLKAKAAAAESIIAAKDEPKPVTEIVKPAGEESTGKEPGFMSDLLQNSTPEPVDQTVVPESRGEDPAFKSDLREKLTPAQVVKSWPPTKPLSMPAAEPAKYYKLSFPGVTKDEDKKNQVVAEIEDKANEGVAKIEDKANEGVTKIEDKTNEGITKIEDKTNEGITKIEDKAKQVATGMEGKVKQETTKAGEKKSSDTMRQVETEFKEEEKALSAEIVSKDSTENTALESETVPVYQPAPRARRQAVIMGGGPVGLATALTLSNDPHYFDVTVIETETSGEDSGVSFYLDTVNTQGLEWFDNFPNALDKLEARGSTQESGFVSADLDEPLLDARVAIAVRLGSNNRGMAPRARRPSISIPRLEMVELLRECCDDQEQERLNNSRIDVGSIQIATDKEIEGVRREDDGRLVVQCTDGSVYEGGLVVTADDTDEGINVGLQDLLGLDRSLKGQR